jgi:hypothetical protein
MQQVLSVEQFPPIDLICSTYKFAIFTMNPAMNLHVQLLHLSCTLYEYDIALGQYKISVRYTKKPKGNFDICQSLAS